jgi:hypothetical protein
MGNMTARTDAIIYLAVTQQFSIWGYIFVSVVFFNQHLRGPTNRIYDFHGEKRPLKGRIAILKELIEH